MIATDPLSLIFLGCALFSGAFLVASTLLGAGGNHTGHLGDGGSHDFHLGGHDMHLGGHAGGHDLHLGAHAGDAVHAGHAGQLGQANGAHTGDSALAHGHASSENAAAQVASSPSFLSTVENTLLGSLNLYGLLIFLLIFGLVGYVVNAVLGWATVFVLLVPLILGGAFAVGLSTLLHVAFATSPETILTADDSRLEGRLGTVTMPIRAGGIGEVIFSRTGSGRQSVGARSATDEALPVGAEVVILDYQNGIASVQSWDTFLAAAQAGVMPELAPIEPESSTPRLEQPSEG